MACLITLEILLGACADDSFDDGIRIDTELVPLAGPGGPVKPAVYEGGTYQQDRRWAAPDDAEPTLVIVIDNVPSQANRLCTAPGFLDTRLRYAAWRSSYCSRASSGVRYASFSRRQHWL